MHMYLVAADVLLVALMVGSGLAGITRGWVIPFGRHRILRPKLWGYGQLMGAFGFSLWMFLGVLPTRFDLLALSGWFIFMASLGVTALAQRPGRTPGPRP
jgi:hypothetical protein